MTAKKKRTPRIGVGSPAILLLDAFGQWIFDAFGEMPYLVGSATRGKNWRDVDIRVILMDEDYDRMFGKRRKPAHQDKRWAFLCAAVSVLGERQTGLPIDFQIDRMTEANEQFPDGVRYPLGIRIEIDVRPPHKRHD